MATLASVASVASVPQLITLEEYLSTSYEPDLEFVDGVLEEKNMGDYEHGFLQAIITHWFVAHRAEWKINVLTEYRTRTANLSVRLPDICVVRQDDPVERVRVTAPLLCIEVLSPDDRPGRVMSRLNEFVAMGTEHLWILDPSDRSAYTYSRSGMKLLAGTRLGIPDSPIYLDVAAMFATLDEG
jgi:Uma2 family endonuclease